MQRFFDEHSALTASSAAHASLARDPSRIVSRSSLHGVDLRMCFARKRIAAKCVVVGSHRIRYRRYVARRVRMMVRSTLKCIFFLTFERSDSIYESRCDFFLNRKFELGESIDEERNQESCCKEESRSEEKEVVSRRPVSGRQLKHQPDRGPGNGAFFCVCLTAAFFHARRRAILPEFMPLHAGRGIGKPRPRRSRIGMHVRSLVRPGSFPRAIVDDDRVRAPAEADALPSPTARTR